MCAFRRKHLSAYPVNQTKSIAVSRSISPLAAPTVYLYNAITLLMTHDVSTRLHAAHRSWMRSDGSFVVYFGGCGWQSNHNIQTGWLNTTSSCSTRPRMRVVDRQASRNATLRSISSRVAPERVVKIT